MYLSFFGLREPPFNLTPDPRFLFMTPSHRQAFDHLIFGVEQRRGFIEVVGGVGTGKTTLCRALLEELEGKMPVALVLSAHLSELDLLRTINEEFGIDASGGSPKALIDALNRFLIGQLAAGGNACLILDECQNLAVPVLEQIRMLSNLETESEKLLQIIMVGQPEFHAMLKTPGLLALDERIHVRAFLEPLTREDTRAYIQHRLTVAGSRGDIVFTERALRVLFEYALGIPRRINTVCDRCLLLAYVQETFRVTEAHAREAVREITAGPRSQRRRRTQPGRAAPSWALMGLGGGIGMVALAMGWLAGQWAAFQRTPTPIAGPSPPSPVLEAVVVPAPDPFPPNQPTEGATPMGTGSPLLSTPAPATQPMPEAPLSMPPAAEPPVTGPLPTAAQPQRWIFDGLGRLAPPSAAARIPDAARAVGLEARQVTVSWDVLARFRRACILELSPEDGGPPRYGVLRGISELEALIEERDGAPRWVPREVFRRIWFGSVWILTPGPRRGEGLIPGSRGEAVRWLQEALERLGHLDGGIPGLFDEDTRRGVMAFQRDTGLPVDGRVGAQTAGMILQLLGDEAQR